MSRPKKGRTVAAKVPAETAAETPCDDYQSDLATSLQRPAQDQQDRQTTRAEALQRWASEDIGRLARVEDGGRWGWGMWRYPV